MVARYPSTAWFDADTSDSSAIPEFAFEAVAVPISALFDLADPAAEKSWSTRVSSYVPPSDASASYEPNAPREALALACANLINDL